MPFKLFYKLPSLSLSLSPLQEYSRNYIFYKLSLSGSNKQEKKV